MAQQMIKRMPKGIEDGLEKMSATEELCIEHAQLDRIMLAMENVMKRAGKSPKTSLRPVYQACEMIRQLVDEHHMKIEEDHIYPQFENTDLADFTRTLKDQHNEARKMLSKMTSLSKGGRPDMDQLNGTFRDFKDMITAHAAFEEACLFTAVEGTWSRDQLDALKEKQEQDEKRLLGEDATQKVYNMLKEIESSCGIEGIRDFTRRSK